jgi:flagellar motor switch protein FliG
MAPALASLGLRKAAIALIQLGRDRAAAVLNYLSEAEVEAITAEIARLDDIDATESEAVLAELNELLVARSNINQGGLEYARNLLVESLGHERATEIIERLQAAAVQLPFQFLHRADPNQLRTFIADEHPQLIALVLAHMRAEKASLVLSGLPSSLQAEVAHRIAVMDRTSPEVIRTVEGSLERRLSSVLQPADTSRVGGVDPLVDIINRSDRLTERQIVEGLEALDAELADEVRSRMFMFEDIVDLEDRSLPAACSRCRCRR